MPGQAVETVAARRRVCAELPEFAWRPVLAIGAALAVLLLATSGRYGYHRDELYFLAAGHHLAWGYPDQPALIPALARLMSAMSPGSVVVLRLPSDVASGVTVVATALMARELGSSRGAQLLAAGSAAAATVVQAAGHLLSTATLNLTFWSVIAWLVIRILRTGNARLWILVGFIAGVGLNDSDQVAFLIAGVAVGIAVAGPRSTFRSCWPWLGGLVAALLWTPYLVWQARHGWPELSIARAIANGRSGTSAPRWQLLPQQLVLVSPYLAPVWIAGLVRLLRNPTYRWCRALAVAWVFLAVVFLVSGGKPYYLGAMLPLLLAAGAEPTIAWARQQHRRRVALGAGLVLSLTALPVTQPLVPLAVLHDTPIVSLNYDAGETVGWPRIVSEVAAAYQAIPEANRSATVLLGSNYGEAGALDRYGPALGLPRAYGVQNAYWLWGPPPDTATAAIAIGFDRARLEGICRQLTLLTRLDNRLSVNDDEQGAPVWLCNGLFRPWSAIWRQLRDYG
ncbi:MAG TPA: glycosyltransferase family 39 protein [Frankiaceae bacterium]|nr:glycosyltransferase family 39 protein [Frankiaceae bacterium]